MGRPSEFTMKLRQDRKAREAAWDAMTPEQQDAAIEETQAQYKRGQVGLRLYNDAVVGIFGVNLQDHPLQRANVLPVAQADGTVRLYIRGDRKRPAQTQAAMVRLRDWCVTMGWPIRGEHHAYHRSRVSALAPRTRYLVDLTVDTPVLSTCMGCGKLIDRVGVAWCGPCSTQRNEADLQAARQRQRWVIVNYTTTHPGLRFYTRTCPNQAMAMAWVREQQPKAPAGVTYSAMSEQEYLDTGACVGMAGGSQDAVLEGVPTREAAEALRQRVGAVLRKVAGEEYDVYVVGLGDDWRVRVRTPHGIAGRWRKASDAYHVAGARLKAAGIVTQATSTWRGKHKYLDSLHVPVVAQPEWIAAHTPPPLSPDEQALEDKRALARALTPGDCFLMTTPEPDGEYDDQAVLQLREAWIAHDPAARPLESGPRAG